MRTSIRLLIVLAFILLGSGVNAQKPKYIFLFIGDGMGISQAHATNTFLRTTGKDSLLFMRFPVQALTSTRCSESYITDSGASGTAIACGEKTLTGVIGMDSSKTRNLTSIAEIAKKNGMKVGIVSSVSIDHATPSAFYAHQSGRSSYYEISLDLANSNFDYFAGGEFEEPTGKDKESRDIYEILKEKSFKIITNSPEFEALKPSSQKVIALYQPQGKSTSLPYSIDEINPVFSLKSFTRKGIELLHNPNGFFMMVEGGKIDWACHSNDGYTVMKEVIAFDEAVAEAYEFYKKYPKETLIIVTADHETGGMSMGYLETGYKLYYDILTNQKVSVDQFTSQVTDFLKIKGQNTELTDIMPLVEKNFGMNLLAEEDYKKLKEEAKTNETLKTKLRLTLTPYEAEVLKLALKNALNPVKEKSQQLQIMYGNNNPFATSVLKIFNNKAGIGWTTYSHTGAPVGTFAIGAGSQYFSGFYENSDFPAKIKKVSGLK